MCVIRAFGGAVRVCLSYTSVYFFVPASKYYLIKLVCMITRWFFSLEYVVLHDVGNSVNFFGRVVSVTNTLLCRVVKRGLRHILVSFSTPSDENRFQARPCAYMVVTHTASKVTTSAICSPSLFWSPLLDVALTLAGTVVHVPSTSSCMCPGLLAAD